MERDTRLGVGLALHDPAMLMATVGGVGLLPWAPGTWGSLLAGILAWIVAPVIGVPALLALAALVFALGCWAADRVATASGQSDPGLVVIDEVVGQWLVLAVAPHTAVSFGAGIVLFRLVDILKPWPIRAMERSFRGGFGIMIDDIAAAGYAGVILYLILKSFG